MYDGSERDLGVVATGAEWFSAFYKRRDTEPELGEVCTLFYERIKPSVRFVLPSGYTA
jgi:hypothetical protein